jgi:archaemetzincin
MDQTKRRIGVLPFGEVPEVALKVIAAHVLGYFNLDADILPRLEHPAYAYSANRNQYNAATILKNVESMESHDYLKVIGLLDVDLFVPILTHVFGEAKQGGNCAVISLYRLKTSSEGSMASESLLLERAAKVALHELGHLFNLVHCMDRRCLMHFSGGLQELDETPLYFCRYCSKSLEENLHRHGIDVDGEPPTPSLSP